MNSKILSLFLIYLFFSDIVLCQAYNPFEGIFFTNKPVYNIYYTNIKPITPRNGFTLKSSESFQLFRGDWIKYNEKVFESDEYGKITKAEISSRVKILDTGFDSKLIRYYEYDNFGRMIKYSSRQLSYGEWFELLSTAFEFDNFGNLIYLKTYEVSDTGLILVSIREWIIKDNIISESVMHLENGDWKYFDYNPQYFLNDAGNIYKTTMNGVIINEYIYDDWGNFLGTKGADSTNLNTYNSQNQLIRNYYTYEYDNYGNLVQVLGTSKTMNNLAKYVFVYNEYGLVTEKQTYNWNSSLEPELIFKDFYEYKKIGESVNQTELVNGIIVNQNFPNPFNSQTNINFYLNSNSFVKIIIYDMLGRKVKELFNGPKKNGYNKVLFEANNLSSGTYFYNINIIQAENGNVNNSTHKMLLIK